MEKQYRIRLDGLPASMTSVELLSELKNQPLQMIKFVERPEVDSNATVRHFYIVRQAAERLCRKRVFSWHDYPIRQSYVVKCQLEYDRISSNATGIETLIDHQRMRKFFERM